jgi:hypothetical protein
MKKLVLLSLIPFLFFAACSSTDSTVEKERQDSADAAATADSMLQAALNADTTALDSAAVDSLARPVH